MNRSAVIVGLVIFLKVLSAQSHPVSFKDSFSIISSTSKNMRELLLNYSFSHRFALSYAYLNFDESEFHIPQQSLLVSMGEFISMAPE